MTDDQPGAIRVLLADDQHLVRSGFSMILSVEPDIVVVGEAANGREAVAEAMRLRPDIVLMDVQMPVLDGIAATRDIVEACAAKVVILTTFDRDDYLFDGLDAGASGFLLKNADPDQLVEAIRAVAHGHALLAPEVTRRVIEARLSVAPPAAGTGTGSASETTAVAGTGAGPAPADPSVRHRGELARHPGAPARTPVPSADLARLTDREREVLVLLGRGRSNAEIARTLYVGEATVKTHVSNILAKLHLRDRVQAVVLAYEAGLILPGE